MTFKKHLLSTAVFSAVSFGALANQTLHELKLRVASDQSTATTYRSSPKPASPQQSGISVQPSQHAFGSDGKEYRWVVTNTGKQPMTNVKLATYIDLDSSPFDNDTVSVQGKSLPSNLPSVAGYDAQVADAWVAGEPGYTSKGSVNRQFNALSLNGSISTNKDDVAMAFSHRVGNLAAGSQVRVSLFTGDQQTQGLAQSDAKTRTPVYVNSVAFIARNQGTTQPGAGRPNNPTATSPSKIPMTSPMTLLMIMSILMMTALLITRRGKKTLLAVLLAGLGFHSQAGNYAGSATVNSQDEADVVAEVVFAIDTSPSMYTAHHRISEVIDETVKGLKCTNQDLWVNAHFYGMRRAVTNTIFNEDIWARHMPKTASLRDDAYHQVPERIAQYYPYSHAFKPGQSYVKALVSIGDGGGVQNSKEMDQHVASNQVAIDKEILLFTIHQKPDAGNDTFNRMKAMSEGGEYIEQYGANKGKKFTFKDTGGLATQFDQKDIKGDELKNNLQAVFCRAAQVAAVKNHCLNQFSARAKFGKVQLQWDKAIKGTTLKLSRSDDDGVTWTELATPTGEIYNDTTAQANRSYAYKLETINSKGEVACRSLTRLRYAPLHNDDDGFHLAPEFTSTPKPLFEMGDGKAYVYQATAVDPEGKPVTMRLKQAPKDATFDDKNNRVNWSPTTSGYERFMLIAEDDQGAKTSQSFVIHAQDAKPYFVTQPPLKTGYSGYWRYLAKAEDKSDKKLHYMIERGSYARLRNRCVKEDCQLWMDLELSTVYRKAGDKLPVILSVTDNKGNYDFQTFELEIVDNRAPYNVHVKDKGKAIHYSTTRVLVNELWQPTAHADDAENDPLTFKLLNAPKGMSIDKKTGQIKWQPTQLGYVKNIEVEAWDQYAFNRFKITKLQVVDPNVAPQFVSQPPADKTIKVGKVWKYRVEVKDPNIETNFDSLKLSVSPRKDDKYRAGVSHFYYEKAKKTGYFILNVTPLVEGDYPLTLSLTDGFETVTQDLTLTATPNEKPKFLTQPSNTTLQVGQTWTYDIEVESFDGDFAVIYHQRKPKSMKVSNHGISLPISTMTLTWTPDTAGQYDFEVYAVDSWARTYGITSERVIQKIRLTVTDQTTGTNTPPTITSSQPTTQPTAGAAWSHTVTATDADANDTLTYSLSKTKPTGMTIDAKTGEITWTPAPSTAGSKVTFTVSVTDGKATATQDITLTVAKPAAQNQPPKITASQYPGATVGKPWSWTVQATDPDGDDSKLVYALVKKPDGMTLQGATLSWTPKDSDAGKKVRVKVRVTDEKGASVTVTLDIPVAAAPKNQLPTLSDINDSAVVGVLWETTLKGDDPDGDNKKLTYALEQQPAGMTLQGAKLSWTPKDSNANQTVTAKVSVTDERGGKATATVTIKVAAAPAAGEGLQIISGQPTEQPTEGVQWTHTVKVNTSGVTYSLLTPPTGMKIDSNGVMTWTPGAADVGQTFRLTAAVSKGKETVQQHFTLRVLSKGMASDKDDPIATITAPVNDATISKTVNVTGTASDTNFVNYRLTLIDRAKKGGEITLKESTTPVTNGTLGVIDPTVLPNGVYDLTLSTTDRDNKTTTTKHRVVIEGAIKPGVANIAFNDARIIVEEIPLTVNRYYDSLSRHRQGDFGYGWDQELLNIKVYTSGMLGNNWKLQSPGGTLGQILRNLVPVGDHKVFIVLGDMNILTFDFTPKSPISTLHFQTAPGYTAAGETVGKLLPIGSTMLKVEESNGLAQLTDNNLPYNPSSFIYEAENGSKLTISKANGLEKVETKDGNTIIINKKGMVNTRNPSRSLNFTRDAQDRITKIVTGNGETVSYEYDANGDLVKHVDKAGVESTFAYDADHRLIQITGPLGNSIDLTYDAAGRLTTQTDPLNNQFSVDYSKLSNNQYISTDANGNVTTNTIDDKGNITEVSYQVTDADGKKVTATEKYTYDAEGNVTQTENADGIISKRSYTEGVGATEITVDPNGLNLTTKSELDKDNRIVASIDVLGNKTTYDYNSDGIPSTMHMPGGNAVTLGINKDESVNSVDAGMGTVVRIEHDKAKGIRIVRTFNKTETVFDDSTALSKEEENYNEDKQLIKQSVYHRRSGALKLVQSAVYEYNKSGNVTKVTDHRGNEYINTYEAKRDLLVQSHAVIGGQIQQVTRYHYDALGRLNRVDYPNNVAKILTHDKNGNVISETAKDLSKTLADKTTTYVYDELNRRIQTTLPDGSTQKVVYSPGGLVLATIDALGQRTTYEYDTAGRKIATIYPKVTDAVTGKQYAPKETYVLDKAGNQIGGKNLNGATLAQTLDKLGKVKESKLNGQLYQKFGYDAIGRLNSITDALGRTKQLAYSAENQLTQVIEPKANASDSKTPITRYRYDSSGQITATTDAAGKTIAYRYNALGQLVERTLPAGQKETYVYNALGQRSQMTDFNGNVFTYQYDAATGRVLSMTAVDAKTQEKTTVDYTYNAFGDLVTIKSDKDGSIHNQYDVMGRLTQQRTAQGTVDYTYNLLGRLTQLKTPNQTQNYTYDAMGRLTQLSDGTNAINYGYNQAGMPVSISFPNGLKQQYRYDPVTLRVTETELTDVNGTVLEKLSYTYNAMGLVLSTTGLNGEKESYRYDDRDRLIQADYQASSTSQTISTAYTYDIVGNRTKMTADGITTTYTYGDNHELLSLKNRVKTVTYKYDAAGNRTKQTQVLTASPTKSQVTDYQWDVFGRLKKVMSDSISTTYQYDPLGNRVGKTNSLGRMGYLATTSSLSDSVDVSKDGKLHELNQVGSNGVVKGGTAADPRYYFKNLLGSILASYDKNGQRIEQQRYDAYGQPTNSSGQGDYGYTGQRHDAAEKLVYLRARYYDPETGVFISRDQFRGVEHIPASLHPYMYTFNNPVNLTDPSGYMTGLAGWMMNLSLRTQINAAVAGVSYVCGRSKALKWVEKFQTAKLSIRNTLAVITFLAERNLQVAGVRTGTGVTRSTIRLMVKMTPENAPHSVGLLIKSTVDGNTHHAFSAEVIGSLHHEPGTRKTKRQRIQVAGQLKAIIHRNFVEAYGTVYGEYQLLNLTPGNNNCMSKLDASLEATIGLASSTGIGKSYGGTGTVSLLSVTLNGRFQAGGHGDNKALGREWSSYKGRIFTAMLVMNKYTRNREGQPGVYGSSVLRFKGDVVDLWKKIFR